MARLYLTGGLRLEGPDGWFGELDLPGHQGRIAFAALAVTRHPISHDGLADIVWDGTPPSQWRSALAAVVSKTRSLLTTTGLDGPSILSSVGGTYCFAPPPDTWIDLSMRTDASTGQREHCGMARRQTPRREATVASAQSFDAHCSQARAVSGSTKRERRKLTRSTAPSSPSHLHGMRWVTTNWLRLPQPTASNWIPIERSVTDS